MIQQEKVSATKPADMNLTPKTYMIEGEDSYQLSSDFICMPWNTWVFLMPTYKINKLIKSIKTAEKLFLALMGHAKIG